MHAPALPGTSRPAHRLAEASQEAFSFIQPNLAERERHVFLLGARYCRETGYQDFTGGELAQYFGESILSIRPRLTGLCDKGWLRSGAIRDSRAHGERRCHPYSLAVPAAAIERIDAMKEREQ